MLVSHAGPALRRTRTGARRSIAAAVVVVLPTVAGCTDFGAANSAWAFASLALLVAGGGAFVIGMLIERRRGERALRAARAELRSGRQLEPGWAWQTDAGHRLSGWRGPGPSSAATCPLFGDDAGCADLRARLLHQQPFTAQRVTAVGVVEGSVGWELHGVPCFDDLGGFTGFIGSARPTDADDALHAAAQALAPTLAASGASAVVAIDHGDG